MTKMLFLIGVLIFGAATLRAQEKWVTQKIDDKVSIKFPVTPKEVKAGSFVASSEDKGTVCIFSIIDVSQFGFDSTSFAGVKTTNQFATNFKNGIKQSLPGFDLEDIKIGTWNGLTSYTTYGISSNGTKIDYFMFVMGTKIYTLVTRRTDAIGVNDRDVFFSSIELKH